LAPVIKRRDPSRAQCLLPCRRLGLGPILPAVILADCGALFEMIAGEFLGRHGLSHSGQTDFSDETLSVSISIQSGPLIGTQKGPLWRIVSWPEAA